MAEWIEINLAGAVGGFMESPLAMAEWIEICDAVVISFFSSVSASDGGVD